MIGKNHPIHATLKAMLWTARKLHRLNREKRWSLPDLAECAKVNDRDARKRLAHCHNNSAAQAKIGRIILHTETDQVDYEAFRR